MPKTKSSESTHDPLLINESEDDLVCGACLLELFSDDHEVIAAPAGCPHLFHWDCLNSWANMQNTCPQCKNRFRVVGKYRSKDREFLECVKFRKCNRIDDSDEEDVDEPDLPLDLCEKCKEPGNDEDLILCDGMDFTCNAMFHFKCVGFDTVPSGLWFCHNCIEKGYIPEELKQKTPKKRQKREDPIRPAISSSPMRSTQSLGQSPPRRITMPAPNLFPRTLVVHHQANRRTESSKIPRNLIQPAVNIILPTTSSSANNVSVFARFRQRRLELKNNRP